MKTHGVSTYDEHTKNFSCPFDPFRTNKELVSHCDAVHQDKLGNYKLASNYRYVIVSECVFG